MNLVAALERDGDLIDRVLRAHGIAGRATGGDVTPRLIRYLVSLGSGADADRVRVLAGELASALGVPSCRVYRQGAQAVVEYPREEAAWPIRLSSLLRGLRNVQPGTAVLGIAEGGEPLLLQLSPRAQHVLIAGGAGCGKSFLLYSILQSLAYFAPPEQLRVLPILDVPGREGLACLEAAREAAGRGRAPVVLAVDGLDDLLRAAPEAAPLLRLLLKAQRAHIVATARTPLGRDVLGLAQMIPIRIVGRVAGPGEARQASGRAGTMAEQLEVGEFVVVGDGRQLRFWAAVPIEKGW